MIRVLMIACALALSLHGSTSCADDWSQWRGENRDGVWKESGIRETFASDDIQPLWRQPVGTGYSSPTVADGRVLLMDFDESSQDESIRCFDAKTGTPLWHHTYHSEYRISYKAGPRAAVTIDGDLAYALGAMGWLHCLNAKDGAIVWKRDLNADYQIAKDRRMPIWGIAASPIVVGDRLILQIGAKDAGVIALNKNTGQEIWRALDDRGQYSSPVLVKQNGNDVVICWTGDSVAGLNPATGKVYWRHPFRPRNMPIGVATPVVQGNQIFLTSFYDGSMMLEMSSDEMTVKQRWHEVGPNERRSKALHSIISTPIWIGEHIYGVDSYGQLRCIEASDGQRVWEDLTAVKQNRWGTIHFVPNGDNIWMLNEQGELMVGQLSPQGLKIASREKILEPNQMRTQNRKGGVCWSHPAFANQCVFARSDSELICISLKK